MSSVGRLFVVGAMLAASFFAIAPAAAVPRDAKGSEAVARLGRGAERFFAADYAAAQQELAPIAAAPLLNHDTVLYLLATSEAMELPPRREQALAHFRALAAMQQSRYAKLARARVADLTYEMGKTAAAQPLYRQLLASTKGSAGAASGAALAPEVDPTVARFRLAEIAAKQGNRSAALDGYRLVFDEFPLHPLADVALERMRVIDEATAVTAKQRLARAQRLTSDHAWQRALDELQLVPADMPAPLRDEVDYQTGMTHFKMRHGYDVAAQKLLAVWPRLPPARRPEALFHGARAWSRADQDDRAIAGYKELVEKFPGAKQSREARFLIGWLDFNRGRFKEGLPALEQVARDRTSFRDDALWYAGFSKWMLGDAAGALESFGRLAATTSGPLDAGKGRYWQGRALVKLGRKPEATATWRELVAEFPFSCYAQQARVRLKEEGVVVGPFGDASEHDPQGGRHVAPIGAIDAQVASDPRVARVDELQQAGLSIEAAAELDRADTGLLQKYGAARAVPVLLDRYLRAGDFFHVHRLAEAHGGGALRIDPRRDAAARGWWERIYPLAYRALVEKYAPTGHNPPYYLYTIMQKESAYNPHDLSYADAIGLLQMIPPTSRRVAPRVGRVYTDDVLYDPEGNIQLGAWYIGRLLEKFKGQVPLGAGSFNAGPRAMMRWVDRNGSHPLDEFIELCAYTQTREYMKKVIEIYGRYEWLYAGRDYQPDETIDARYLVDEIDY